VVGLSLKLGEPLVGTATLRLVVTRGFAPGSVGSGVIPQIFCLVGGIYG